MPIRQFAPSDMTQILSIWLEASVGAHTFVERAFWESKLPDMRNTYLPSSEVHVYLEGEEIKAFLALKHETLEALFVAPTSQGRSIGRKLMQWAQQQRPTLNLAVYQANNRAVDFYKQCGFTVTAEQQDPYTGQHELLMHWHA